MNSSSDIPNSPPESIPARTIQNYFYCPRLMYFQFVEKVFVPSPETIEGDRVHSRVDRPTNMPDFPEDIFNPEKTIHRSLYLASDKIGVHGVVDLVEKTDEDEIAVVDYKRGTKRRDENGNLMAKEADEIQVRVYALLLEENDIHPEKGFVFYANERVKIPVDISPAKLAEIPSIVSKVRSVAAGKMPDPLRDDLRCLYCSLYPVCLPNETAFWRNQSPLPPSATPPIAGNPDGEFIIVQDPRAYISKKRDMFVISLNGEIVSKHPQARVKNISLYGAPQFSTQVLQACLEKDIPISFFSPAGRYLGTLATPRVSGLDARAGQYNTASSETRSTAIAARMIQGKINNQRAFLMRNASDLDKDSLDQIARMKNIAEKARSRQELTGIEGKAAAVYFASFDKMIKSDDEAFRFKERNKRPPRDPVNSMLSLGYSVLSSEIAGICYEIGLDPACGILHAPRYGRMALALDLMEEFRPLIVDSVAVSLVNRGEVSPSDFIFSSKGCNLNANGRKAFWKAYFKRMNTETTHPEFKYKMTYRGLLEIQARQLWRIFRGDAEEYFPILTR